MRPKLLCTLGPTSLRPDIINALATRGVDLFRLNLSHTPIERVESTITFLQAQSAVPICLDTQGAQVRCGTMSDDVVLRSQQVVRLTSANVIGTTDELTLWPSAAFVSLAPGHTLTIDFDGALLRVISVAEGRAEAVVLEPGRVKSNRAVTIRPSPALPALTEKDVAAIEIGVKHGLKHYALSFASGVDDVQWLRTLLPNGSYVISKIESRAGVQNMDGIIAASDAVLIDRGDLSREVAIEHVPMYQKHIIRRANTWNKPVFVATNLLESMIQNRRPTVAEANDIVNTLLDGAHGLVLAAETAVGAYPVRAVEMISRIIDAFEESTSLIDDTRSTHPPMARIA